MRDALVATLRAARADDLAACAALLASASGDGRAPPRDALPLLRHAFQQSGAAFLVAEAGGALAGFATAWPRDGQWWIGHLVVRPDARRAGIGSALLAEVVAPGARAATVFTLVGADPAAAALCLRHGLLPRASVLTMRIEPAPGDKAGGYALAPLRKSSLAFERARFGYARGHDHRFLAENGMRGFELQRPDGVRAGFLYADADAIGPAAFEAGEDVAPALALAAHACGGAARVRVPATNEDALRWCIARGGRVEGVELLMSRAPLAPLDLALLGGPGLA